MDWEGYYHMYGWLEPMVHHTPSKVEAESVPVFLHPWWSILGVLCDQYGCDPLALLFVQWWTNLIHVFINELRVVSTYIWMIGAHGNGTSQSHTIQGKSKKYASFHQSTITHGPSLECCVASMDVTPLLCCLYNGVSTPSMNGLMN